MATQHTHARPGDRAGLLTIGGGALLATGFALDLLTGAFDIGTSTGRTDYLAAYALLAAGTLLLAAGVTGTAMVYRRRFGTFALAGLVSGAAGFLVTTLGAAMNFTAASGTGGTGGAVVFSGLALSALAAFLTGAALLRIDVARLAGASLVVGFLAFAVVLVVGHGVVGARFDLVLSLYGLLLAAGWGLFGDYVRSRVDIGYVDRAAPAA